MTSTIAFIGKSGSGKTTLTKGFCYLLKSKFKNAAILLVDNDLTLELSDSFDIKTKNTIYGIKSGKHEYKTGIPDGMTKQEYIDWAMEDIIVNIDENIDIIASWFVTPKDCKCLNTKLIRDSFSKLIDRYDFVIFDCEYDLKYLNALVDYPLNEAIIVTTPKEKNIKLAHNIYESSKKYTDGQLGVIINNINSNNLEEIFVAMNKYELDLIGTIKHLENPDYKNVANVLENFYSRMNLPQNQ